MTSTEQKEAYKEGEEVDMKSITRTKRQSMKRKRSLVEVLFEGASGHEDTPDGGASNVNIARGKEQLKIYDERIAEIKAEIAELRQRWDRSPEQRRKLLDLKGDLRTVENERLSLKQMMWLLRLDDEPLS